MFLSYGIKKAPPCNQDESRFVTTYYCILSYAFPITEETRRSLPAAQNHSIRLRDSGVIFNSALLASDFHPLRIALAFKQIYCLHLCLLLLPIIERNPYYVKGNALR